MFNVIQVLSNTECKTGYGYGNTQIMDSMICAGVPEGGKDTCQV